MKNKWNQLVATKNISYFRPVRQSYCAEPAEKVRFIIEILTRLILLS